MKKLTELDVTLKELSGEDVQGVSGPLTRKTVLTQSIGVFFTSPNAEENIQAYGIAQKLFAATDSVELEDADLKLLQKSMEKMMRDQRYSPIVIAQILQYMESIKE